MGLMSWVALMVHLEESCQNARLLNSNYNYVEECNALTGALHIGKKLCC
jgi:hypothetical protein